MRRLAHRMVDDAIDYTAGVRDRPVWQAMPDDVRAGFRTPLPRDGRPLDRVYGDLTRTLMPYAMGNVHPRFWMWFMGSSNFTGALGDFLAAVQGLQPRRRQPRRGRDGPPGRSLDEGDRRFPGAGQRRAGQRRVRSRT